MDSNLGFRDAAAYLFHESFEGKPDGQEYTWYVQGKEGILDALASVDAATASRSLASGSPSLAGHAYHLRYALQWANVPQGETPPEGGWESSWAKQTVDDAEWTDLAQEIEERYRRFVAWFSTNEDWSHEDGYVSTLALLPHVAYHLGAMRQLIGILKPREL